MYQSKAAGLYSIEGRLSGLWDNYTINRAPPRYKTLDVAADGFKGREKERSDKDEYNHFTILPFCKEDISASVFHLFTV